MLYFILDGKPYVSVSNVETAGPAINSLAHNFNEIIYGILLVGGSFYWLISIIICGWFLQKYIRYRIKRNQNNRETP